jgi:hypothetical protein
MGEVLLGRAPWRGPRRCQAARRLGRHSGRPALRWRAAREPPELAVAAVLSRGCQCDGSALTHLCELVVGELAVVLAHLAESRKRKFVTSTRGILMREQQGSHPCAAGTWDLAAHARAPSAACRGGREAHLLQAVIELGEHLVLAAQRVNLLLTRLIIVIIDLYLGDRARDRGGAGRSRAARPPRRQAPSRRRAALAASQRPLRHGSCPEQCAVVQYPQSRP